MPCDKEKAEQKQILDLVESLGLPVVVDFPVDNVMRVRLNSPRTLKCIPAHHHEKYDKLWSAYESLNTMRVAILTGTGRVFCAGADLIGWRDSAAGDREKHARKVTKLDDNQDTTSDPAKSVSMWNGFLGISDRTNKKPIIAALNGSSYGGGTEALLNCDLVVANASATIALPEPRSSVAALAGALPRLGRLLPIQRAMEIALLAEPISSYELFQWGIVNRIGNTAEDVQKIAIELAQKILLGSPESIALTFDGVRRGYEQTQYNLKESTTHILTSELAKKMNQSDNIQEGLLAFSEKRKPKWKL